uniref:Kelch domain-containing protein 8B n=1 Tax=Cyprinus carpio TaxID=7962 RepID=A0A8C1WHW1_CYPCA
MPIPEMALSPVKSLYWEVFPSMATQRVYCMPVLWAGRLYVLGGCSENGLPLDSAEVLDLESQRWCELPPLPTARAGASAVAVGDQLMVMGGMDAQQSPLASVEVYHPDEGKWERKTGLGQASMGITILENDGKVYALGGMGADTTPQASVRLYEPTKDQWLPLTTMPTPRYGAFSFLRGNKIYVLGVWLKATRSCRMREKRADFVAGCLGGRVIAAGGLGNQPSPLASVESYNQLKRRWEPVAPLPSPRCSCASIQTPNMLFLIGGVSQGPSNAVEALCLKETV